MPEAVEKITVFANDTQAPLSHFSMIAEEMKSFLMKWRGSDSAIALTVKNRWIYLFKIDIIMINHIRFLVREPVLF